MSSRHHASSNKPVYPKERIKWRNLMTTHLFPSDELIAKLESHAGISLLASRPNGVNQVSKSVHGIKNSSRLSGIGFRILLKWKVSFKMSYYMLESIGVQPSPWGWDIVARRVSGLSHLAWRFRDPTSRQSLGGPMSSLKCSRFYSLVSANFHFQQHRHLQASLRQVYRACSEDATTSTEQFISQCSSSPRQ